jgi:hypothetical protein
MTNLHSEMQQLNAFKEQTSFKINIRSIHHGRTESLEIKSRESFDSILPRACALFGVDRNNWDLEYNGTNLTGRMVNAVFNSRLMKEIRGIVFFDNMTLDLVRRPTQCFGFTCKRPKGVMGNTPKHRNV